MEARYWIVVSLLVLAGLVWGCDNSPVPLEEGEAGVDLRPAPDLPGLPPQDKGTGETVVDTGLHKDHGSVKEGGPKPDGDIGPTVATYEVRGYLTSGFSAVTSTSYRLLGGFTPFVSSTNANKLTGSSYTLVGGFL